MDVTVQRTESDRSQNGGPRVSFNRDVHVKRIGSRPQHSGGTNVNTTTTTSTTPPACRRELPTDLLYEDGILKEAALVLAQADSVKCTAEGSNEVVGGRVNTKSRGPIEKRRSFDYNSNTIFPKNSAWQNANRFNSLPTRKSKQTHSSSRPVARSVSDASSKKLAASTKRPSIFSIFSRKSDSNLHDFEKGDGLNAGGNNVNRKRVGRSKSDVGSQPNSKLGRRSNISEKEVLSFGKKNAKPLSPIIEQSTADDLIKDSFSLPRPVVPKRSRDKPNESKSVIAGSYGRSAEGPDTLESNVIQGTITKLMRSNSRTGDMHSSQLPPQKPPLTKGITVDGMVKRLSMERFSPPPNLCGPAFSYTRPRDSIIYAHVVCDTDGRSKQTAQSSTPQIGLNASSHPHLDSGSKNTSQNVNREPPPIRHHSDEDEGLGLEMKAAKLVNDDFITTNAHRISHRDPRPVSDEEFKSVAEDLPITPKIRDVPPDRNGYQPEIAMRGRADGMDERVPIPELVDLNSRRELLESRIKSRRYGSRDVLNTEDLDLLQKKPGYHTHFPQDYRTVDPVRMAKPFSNRDYTKRLSPPSRDIDYYIPSPNHQERYQRSRSMDVDVAGPNYQTTKYNKLSSVERKGLDGRQRESETVFIDDLDTHLSSHHDKNEHFFEKYDQDGSEIPRKAPEPLVQGGDHGSRYLMQNSEWRSKSEPTRRNEKIQRSFDKGDSGIENDYRKDSFTDRDLRRKWTQRTYEDDRRACEIFLRKEQQDSVDNHNPLRLTNNNSFRERSIDDGSHYDARLDRYDNRALQKGLRAKSMDRSLSGTLEKKKSGLEKVRQLLSGSSKKSKSPLDSSLENQVSRDKRLSDRRDEGLADPQIPDIATRRRLSTPKASPAMPKRSASQKSSKSSYISETPNKLNWFKSLDRLSRKKKMSTTLPPSSRSSLADDRVHANGMQTLSRHTNASSLGESPKSNMSKTLRFFGDTDIESNTSLSKGTIRNKLREPSSPSSSLSRYHKAYSKSAYDLNTNPINTSNHRSTSLQHLDETDRSRGKQLNGRYNSKSRHLHDISESASDNEPSAAVSRMSSNRKAQNSSSLLSGSSNRKQNSIEKQLSKQRSSQDGHSTLAKSSTLNRNGNLGQWENERRRSLSEDAKSISRNDNRKPPLAPQKPARTFQRRRSMSRDRAQDSSGTDSSQLSQRSVVYLHATTVGDIPRPHWLHSRSQAASRESVGSKIPKNQPMTRTVTRSYSVLTPWTPKHLRDGYEINYSQQSHPHQNLKSHHAKKMATHKKGPSNTSTLPKSMTRTNTNTLTHYKRSPTSTILSPRNVGHQLNIDKPSPSKISNNHSLYRPMDRSAERRFEEPERYTKRYPEPASRY